MERTPDETNASDMPEMDSQPETAAPDGNERAAETAVTDASEPEHETDLLAGVEPVDAPAPPTHEDLTGSPDEPLVEEPEAHDADDMAMPEPSIADEARVDEPVEEPAEPEPDVVDLDATTNEASEEADAGENVEMVAADVGAPSEPTEAGLGDEVLTGALDDGPVSVADPFASRDSVDEEPQLSDVLVASEAVQPPPDTVAEPAPEPEPGAVAEEDESLLEWQPGEWFVVHTYAGYENKVKTNLLSRIVSMNMEEKIYEVVIPVEDVMEVKSGKKQVVQRKVFPGYLLVRMDLDDDSWYVVRNTPGVTGFVGSGTKPIPLSEREVDRVLQRKGAVEERPKPKLEFSSGDNVRVVTGPFANFQGIISEIDIDRSKLKVLVNIFGRETPVELGFDQVAKV